MPLICTELLGSDCRECIDTGLDCIRVIDVLQHYFRKCIKTDLEQVIIMLNNKPVNIDDIICESGEIKIIRILRGG